MLSNLVGPSPTPIPSFNPIPQSTTKHIAVHTYLGLHTYSHTDLDNLVVKIVSVKIAFNAYCIGLLK